MLMIVINLYQTNNLKVLQDFLCILKVSIGLKMKYLYSNRHMFGKPFSCLIIQKHVTTNALKSMGAVCAPIKSTYEHFVLTSYNVITFARLRLRYS